MVVSLPIKKNEAKTEKEPANVSETVQIRESREPDYAAVMEKKLEELLSQMENIGKVKVMITLKTSAEQVVEKDAPVKKTRTTEEDSAGGNRIIESSEYGDTTVYHGTKGGEEPYIIKEIYPKIEGVVVAAQGADIGKNRAIITDMVKALFDIEVHKISVVKMKMDE